MSEIILQKKDFKPGQFGNPNTQQSFPSTLPAEVQRVSTSEEPKPIEFPLPKVYPMEPEMIPEAYRDWLCDISERMSCPLDFVAVTAIVVTGIVIGNRCVIQPKELDYGWQIVPNLWGGIVAPPSALKTPATDSVLSILKSLEKKAQAKYQNESIDAKVTFSILDAQQKSLLNKAKKGDADGSIKRELIEIEQQKESVNPALKRYRVNDATPEKLADICTQNPQGVLVFRDELAGLLRSWEKAGNESARAFYLEAWNGKGSFRIDRIVRGSTLVKNLCVSVFGSIQPDKLHSFVNEMHRGENDGLIQRFQLLIYPDIKKFEYVDRSVNEDALENAQTVITSLAECTDFISYGAEKDYQHNDEPNRFRFDSEAQALFIEWLENLQSHIEGDELGLEKQHFSKYRSLMPSLALIFHLIDVATFPDRAGRIKAHSVKQAIAWTQYLSHHAMRIYGIASLNKASAIALSKKISSGKLEDGFKVRDIQQKSWSRLTDAKAIKSAISELIEADWIEEVPADNPTSERGGRPKATAYRILPGALNYYQRKQKH